MRLESYSRYQELQFVLWASTTRDNFRTKPTQNATYLPNITVCQESKENLAIGYYEPDEN